MSSDPPVFGTVYLTNYWAYDDAVFTNREPDEPPFLQYALFIPTPHKAVTKTQWAVFFGPPDIKRNVLYF